MDALRGSVGAVVALLAALATELETLWFLLCRPPLPPRPKRLLKPPVDSLLAAGSSRMMAPRSVGPGDFVRCC